VPSQTLKHAQGANLVIFVSPAAVRFAYALLPKLRFGRDICVCALGAATAQALHRHGVAEVQYPRARHDSEGLLALAVLKKLRGRTVALIGAAGGREVLPRELRARGARLECVHVYLRRSPRLDRRHHAAIESATAPLITLISSVDILVNLHAILPAALFARLAVGDWVVSSSRVAQAARRLGCARVHIAASATSEAMLAAACAALAHHRL
jgi:uroporphyrinogen-III synthase